jgi:formylglycine-generating enzyme required for sulfatase activity
VGDPGNACDPQPQACLGAVQNEYRISKFEVTNTQYAEFLNAVAKADTHGLYSTSMSSGSTFGGITRSGTPGNFSYSVVAIRAAMPVNHVSFWDAARFANWLHNGQPTGLQDATTTEDGAYTLTPTDIANNTVTRNAEAAVFVTSEDEWYKAAYYDAGAHSYLDYPAGSNTPTTCNVPGSASNTANCQNLLGTLSNVGSYTGSATPSGTFDQGGNVGEWDEFSTMEARGLRGGDYFLDNSRLAASTRISIAATMEDRGIGFRVGSRVSAPPVPSLSRVGMVMLGVLFVIAGMRKLREWTVFPLTLPN